MPSHRDPPMIFLLKAHRTLTCQYKISPPKKVLHKSLPLVAT